MYKWLTLVLIALFATSCVKEDIKTNNDINKPQDNLEHCDNMILPNAQLFADAPNYTATINSLEIDGDCLHINFSEGACNGESWQIQLIDSELILESFPPQRNLKFILRSTEFCEAHITKSISFDISPIQVENSEVVLNIINADTSILYTY